MRAVTRITAIDSTCVEAQRAAVGGRPLARLTRPWVNIRRYTRAEADAVFREAMEVVGVPAWRRAVLYHAVRMGRRRWGRQVRRLTVSAVFRPHADHAGYSSDFSGKTMVGDVGFEPTTR